MDSTPARNALCFATMMALLFLSVTPRAAATPPNDSFTNAVDFILDPVIPFEPTTIQFTGTLAGATIESDEMTNLDLANYNQRGTIWWKWNCTTSSILEFVAYSMTGSVMAAAFEGDSLTNLTTVSTPMIDPFLHPEMTFDAGIAAFYGYPGKTYWFVLMPLMDMDQPVDFIEGHFSVSPSVPPPPPVAGPTNDHFANRIALAGTNWSVNGNIEAATLEPDEAVGPPWDPLQASAWYTWTSPTNGVVYFIGTTFVSNPTFRLSVFRGASLANLILATLTVDGGYAVTPGDTLQVQIGSPYSTGWAPTNGSGEFALSALLKARLPASTNDLFANRLDISLPGYHFEGSIYNANSEIGEPNPPNNLTRTLWWRFLAPEDGVLRISLSGPYPLAAAVYQGETFASMTRVENHFTNRFYVKGGREYSIQIGSANNPSGGITVDTFFRSTSNDMFVGAIRMEGTNCTAESEFGEATFEAGEPNPGETNTIWFSWASPGTGRVWYSPYHAWWQPAAVYSGYTLETLNTVRYGGGLGNGEIGFLAEEGKLYYFQYSGGNSETVKLALRLEPFVPTSNDNFADAARLKSGYNFGSVITATSEPGEPEHLDGKPTKSIWWKWQAPTHTHAYVSLNGSLARNLKISVFIGSGLENLALVAQGTNDFYFTGNGGVTYYIAASVTEDEIGDVMLSVGGAPIMRDGVTISLPVPGNLLMEPSWEGTSLQPQHWQVTGTIGGAIRNFGGTDGATWPTMSAGAAIAQTISVTPGHQYQIRFAMEGSTAPVQVKWNDTIVGVTNLPLDEMGYWHWVTYTTEATTSTARIEFKNLGTRFDQIELDAFSVVDLTAPPSINKQPVTLSVVAGGTAAFLVGVDGSSPLHFQWFQGENPVLGGTNAVLTLPAVEEQQGGDYRVVITNAFGAVTSTFAVLTIEAPTNATIVLQPHGDTVPVGSYFNLSVAAIGTLPLRYQWFLDEIPILNATNRSFAIETVQHTDKGKYEVRVQNPAGTVWSLPAHLTVTNAINGGGTIDFRNRSIWFGTASNYAPVFDFDGSTPLAGSSYLAQLYAGTTLETLRPIGSPSPFRSGYDAGYFVSKVLTLPSITPNAKVFTQVRAWEAEKGSTYEEARALGGKFGRSEFIEVLTGTGLLSPTRLAGLASFSLQAGQPSFTVGVIEFVERRTDNGLVWSLRGEPGFRYVLERTDNAEPVVWRPYLVITNDTGTVTFTDSGNPRNGRTFYRARILD